MIEHELKTWPQYFGAILDGSKTFEARFDDREFEVGDALYLREWDPETEAYTGRETRRTVSYKLSGHADSPSLREGYCVLGLREGTDSRSTSDVLSWALRAIERHLEYQRIRGPLVLIADNLRLLARHLQTLANRAGGNDHLTREQYAQLDNALTLFSDTRDAERWRVLLGRLDGPREVMMGYTVTRWEINATGKWRALAEYIDSLLDAACSHASTESHDG